MLTTPDPYNNDSRGTSDFLHKDVLSSRPETYSLNYISGIRSEPGVSGLSAGASIRGYQSPFEDPNLHGHGRDGLGVSGVTAGASLKSYQTPFEDSNLHGYRRDGLGVSGLTAGANLSSYQTPFEDSNLHGYQRDGPGISGLTAGASIKGYQTSYEDPNLLGYRRDLAPGINPGIADVSFERPNSLRRSTGPPVEPGVSNILFVDGLPTDCTRRELGHLFRPFIGFREIRVVHKEPRRRGDKAMVLCFVEFTDAKCAVTALEALQGYKFDDKKPDSPLLKLHFAHFPFRLPSDRDDQRV